MTAAQQDTARTVESAMRGDREALNALFAPCITRLQKVAIRMLNNVEDSEDAVQDALLSAFKKLDQFRGQSQFTTWVHSIVVNAARTQLRKRRLSAVAVSLNDSPCEDGDFSFAEILADPHARTEQDYERGERRQLASEIVHQLPPTWSAVVQLYDIEGLQMKEVASKLGLSVPAVKTRHFRASQRISRLVSIWRARKNQRTKRVHGLPVVQAYRRVCSGRLSRVDAGFMAAIPLTIGVPPTQEDQRQ